MNSNQDLKTGIRKRKRRWIPYVGVALLIAAIVAGMWPKPMPVETGRASVGLLRASIDEEGKTRIKDRFVVSAPVTGQLRRIPFKPGAEVQARETILAIIDPLAPTLLDTRSRSLAEASRDTAAANLEKARITHGLAKSELKRFEKLFGDKTISIQELETVQTREASGAKDLAAAESALRQAEAELVQFTSNSTTNASTPVEVRVPASGRILRLFEESSRAISTGAPLAEIGDPTNLEIVIETLSRDGAAIAPGTKVELEQWGPGTILEARVRLVEPAAFTKVSALGVEEQRVNVVADFVSPVELWRNLGDNFRVEAKIIVWENEKALKVSSGALFRHGQDWAAFVMSDERAHLRIVKIGRTSGSETQVLDGLKEGDEVILYPGDRIHDGQRVKRIKI
ncbi:MAG: yknX [Verrucomicrobiales bacterium]|nr:yknX [Verrucomicrobiales bacterium]